MKICPECNGKRNVDTGIGELPCPGCNGEGAVPDNGLFGKFLIRKTDGTPLDPGALYFVLRYDNSRKARRAIQHYAATIANDNPKLSDDLFREMARAEDREILEGETRIDEKKITFEGGATISLVADASKPKGEV